MNITTLGSLCSLCRLCRSTGAAALLVVGQTLPGIVISHFRYNTRLHGVWGIYPGDQGAMKAALTIGGLWNVVGARSP